ncbi:hypothetical protein [Paraburkholderia metrosideri]|uniref:Uncharacterized protein n=1 Tax=Paraburkholderia metrosideri TaxID=580937 RepID=A0ABN7HZ44_9BURK|nr:hypothetical protein [Paraburkholderia metrosideri]CAD6538028.1 hypothetical protein LMG28140_03249 [Paraburkholderia metrosideri]
MSTLRNFDDDARAAMLCYLVVAELVAMASTGEWLRTDHIVESSRIWMSANGVACDWQDRVALAGAAVLLAPDILEAFKLTTGRSLTPLFSDGWMLDYQSPIVCETHGVCADYLAQT